MTTRRATALAVAVLCIGACSSSGTTASPTVSASSGPSTSNGGASASASAPARPLRILVSNDDGVGAPGIDALVNALIAERDVTVTVVAPAENQSGTGGKTTAGTVTATSTTTASGYAATSVQGFPADAVLYGLTSVLKERPDVVITGTNAGQNIGPAIDLSGTVGAARAAAQRGIPALAVSAGFGDPIDFATVTGEAIKWLRDHRAGLLASPAPSGSVDNLNAPTCTAGKVRGLVTTTPELTAPLADALAPPDCTSTASAPSGDVAAFHAGFVTLESLPLQPTS